MGVVHGKTNSFDPNLYNFSQYGLTPQEVALFNTYFKSTAGRDGRLNRSEFMKMFAQMNPQLNGPNLQEYADRAFVATDANRDGAISFDEFLFSYVTSKYRNQPYNFQSNMVNLLNSYTPTPGFISPSQAYNYVSYMHNYSGQSVNLPSPDFVYTQFQNYGEMIPVESFVETVTPLYLQYL